MAFEYLHLCHHSRKKIVIIKLDFEKAFDKIERQDMLTLMKAKGFGQKWLNWISDILESRTSAVILMEFMAKHFIQKRIQTG